MFYRIVQEVINNTLKHANAAQINITCRYRKDRIYLTCADNGQDFNYNRVGQGLSLGNIESCGAMPQGTIEWQSESEKGTSVIIMVPLSYANGKLRRAQTAIKIPF